MFNVAVADALRAPVVNGVNLVGFTGQACERITVRASDDFEVVDVTVEITDAGGTLLESGAAVKSMSNPEQRVYTTTTTSPFADRAGHRHRGRAHGQHGLQDTDQAVRAAD